MVQLLKNRESTIAKKDLGSPTNLVTIICTLISYLRIILLNKLYISWITKIMLIIINLHKMAQMIVPSGIENWLFKELKDLCKRSHTYIIEFSGI